MASDFAIAQFRYLEPLLMVHGHWCYKRISLMVQLISLVNTKCKIAFKFSFIVVQTTHEPKFILSWDYDKALGLGHSRNKGPRIGGSQSPMSRLKNVPQPFGFT